MKAGLFTRISLGLILVGLASCGPKASSLGPEKKEVDLKVVKHADLMKAIAANKGKVVLVDFWATWCGPCVEKFPKVVHLNEELEAKGLVCISASFNDPNKKEIDKAHVFLKEKKAVFANYLIEDREECQMKLDFTSVPLYLIYSKDGKLAASFGENTTGFTFEQIREAVEKELK